MLLLHCPSSAVEFKDLKPFDSKKQPFVKFQQRFCDEFNKHAGVVQALEAMRNGEPQPRFKWDYWKVEDDDLGRPERMNQEQNVISSKAPSSLSNFQQSMSDVSARMDVDDDNDVIDNDHDHDHDYDNAEKKGKKITTTTTHSDENIETRSESNSVTTRRRNSIKRRSISENISADPEQNTDLIEDAGTEERGYSQVASPIVSSEEDADTAIEKPKPMAGKRVINLRRRTTRKLSPVQELAPLRNKLDPNGRKERPMTRLLRKHVGDPPTYISSSSAPDYADIDEDRLDSPKTRRLKRNQRLAALRIKQTSAEEENNEEDFALQSTVARKYKRQRIAVPTNQQTPTPAVVPAATPGPPNVPSTTTSPRPSTSPRPGSPKVASTRRPRTRSQQRVYDLKPIPLEQCSEEARSNVARFNFSAQMYMETDKMFKEAEAELRALAGKRQRLMRALKGIDKNLDSLTFKPEELA
jgi:hypothetical protein